MQQLSSKISANVQKINVYETEISKLNNELTENKEKHNKLENEIKQTERALESAKNEYGQNSKEANELKQKLLQLKDSFNNVEKEIEENTHDLNKYQTELNNTQAEVNSLSKELKRMPFNEIGEKLTSTGNSIKDVGQTLTAGVTTPLLAVGTAATVAGVNFDTSMSKLQATAGIADKTSDSYLKLKEKALEMGSSTSFSASEAADGLTYLALAGWDVETQIERIEPVLRAAEAGGMELATASDKITDSMSSAGVASKDFSKYLDIVAQAQRRSNTSMEEMLDAYIVGGGIFKSLNMELDESGALLGILANRGTKGSEAGNALISVFSNLITETGQAGGALDALNISLYDSTGKQRNMIEVLKEMANKLGVNSDETSNLTEKQEQQYAAMVGGKTQFDTLMKLLAGVSDEYDELQVSLQNSTGALEEMSLVMKDNLGGSIENMKSAIEGALIKAFEAMLPVLENVVGKITDAANWFSSLDEEQQQNIVTIAAIVAAIGPVLMIVGQLIIVGGNLVTLLGATSGASGVLTKALGVLSGPTGIALLVTALVGLISIIGDSENAIYLLQDKFGGLGVVIGAVCEYISGVVQMTFGNIIIIIEGVMNMIAAIIDGPGGLTITDAWKNMNSKLLMNTEEAQAKLQLTTTQGMSQLRSMTESELNKLVDTTDLLMNQIPVIAEGNYSEASNAIATQLQGMSSNQLTALTGMNDTTKHLFQGINTSMTVEAMAAQVAKNMQQMNNAGSLEVSDLEKDVSSAMDLIKTNIDKATSEAASKADTNTKDLANKVESNTNYASSRVDLTTKQLLNNVDTNTKNASNKADTNTKDLANKVENNTSYASSRVDLTTKQLLNNVDTNTKNASNKADANTKDLANKVDTNIQNAGTKSNISIESMTKQIDNSTKDASNKANANTKDLVNNVDSNTKELSNKASANFKDMSNKADSNTRDASNKAISNMNSMKDGVLRATSSMTSSAISDWNRLRNEFSRGISGQINITRTTTNVVQSQQAQGYADEAVALSTIDTSPYITRGSYFNSNNGISNAIKSNILNESLKSNFSSGSNTIEIKLAIDNVTVKNAARRGADAPVRCRRCARSRAALLSGIRCERENAANRLRHAKLSRHHAGRTVEKIATRNIKTGLCRNENFRHNP